MPGIRSTRPKKDILARVVVDILLVNVSVIGALTVRFFYLVVFEGSTLTITYETVFWNYVRGYRNTAFLLTAICLCVFAISGFYTRGRAYQGRYKALVITQAASLAFLRSGFTASSPGGILERREAHWSLDGR